mmetsp:Transcript_29706/g.74703  ORF Transcript_29706/g.74703 Transcript_29706/m.74703 type:complete len:247 (-) Transcript_29706:1054-1794(-)
MRAPYSPSMLAFSACRSFSNSARRAFKSAISLDTSRSTSRRTVFLSRSSRRMRSSFSRSRDSSTCRVSSACADSLASHALFSWTRSASTASTAAVFAASAWARLAVRSRMRARASSSSRLMRSFVLRSSCALTSASRVFSISTSCRRSSFSFSRRAICSSNFSFSALNCPTSMLSRAAKSSRSSFFSRADSATRAPFSVSASTATAMRKHSSCAFLPSSRFSKSFSKKAFSFSRRAFRKSISACFV